MFLSLRYSKMVNFILSNTLFVKEKFPPRRDSGKCQLLRLYSQFSFTKILKALKLFYVCKILEQSPKALLKIFLIDIDRLESPRRPQSCHF